MFAYRLFENKDGEPHTLFHGVDGSRKVETDTWLLADQREVRDGSSQNTYRAGFHVVKKYQEMVSYLGKFKAPRTLVVCPVWVAGEIREKEHSPSPVLLAQKMKVKRSDWEYAKRFHSFNVGGI